MDIEKALKSLKLDYHRSTARHYTIRGLCDIDASTGKVVYLGSYTSTAEARKSLELCEKIEAEIDKTHKATISFDPDTGIFKCGEYQGAWVKLIGDTRENSVGVSCYADGPWKHEIDQRQALAYIRDLCQQALDKIK